VRRIPLLITLLCILYFWANGIADLDRFPRIHEDEAWIAAPGVNFWSAEHFGTFGTPLFAGYYGMEQHYYGFMPLFPLWVGFGVRLLGLGLFQIRLASLIVTTLTLALTYRVGASLFTRWHGMIAVVVLVGWKITVSSTYFYTGIPLADMARLTRYDNLVALLGLLGLLSAHKRKMFGAGMSVGLAALSHIYGAFWLLFGLFSVKSKRDLVSMGVGFCLTLLPYGLFVIVGGSDAAAQQMGNRDRFQISSVDFYQQNLSNEPLRYQPIVDALIGGGFGAWLWLITLIFGVIYLLRSKQKRASRVLLLGLVAQILLFALLLKPKTFMYLTTLMPLFALVTAAAMHGAWKSRLVRPIIALACALAIIEGVISYQALHRAATQTTPYSEFMERVARLIPPDSEVLAMHHYWVGLADDVSDYRALLVPMWLTNPLYVENPLSFADVLAQHPPDIILIDETTLYFFLLADDPAHSYHQLVEDMRAYLMTGERIARLTDPTYGRMLVFQFENTR
jgi:hypothetical protein